MGYTTDETIACGCLLLRDGTCYLVPHVSHPADVYNYHLKHNPAVQHLMIDLTTFVTSHGRVVTAEEARSIALRSGQLDETRDKTRLTVMDLFPKELGLR